VCDHGVDHGAGGDRRRAFSMTASWRMYLFSISSRRRRGWADSGR